FSPLRPEFRNLSFLITADDISGVEEQKGDCICWQEEKKECTQGKTIGVGCHAVLQGSSD
ncbi:unnamed protein product, partial [Rangifer tarandus platyrhynchus]